MITRRKLLLGGAVFGALSLYSHQRGLRYPRLSFEHEERDLSLSSGAHTLEFIDCIAIDKQTLRAIAPEPKIELCLHEVRSQLLVRNLAANAELSIDTSKLSSASRKQLVIDESIDGLDRSLSITGPRHELITLNWTIPVKDGFDFAIMGDTGGGSELSWTLKRAHQLGAQFLLHLGDFNYTEGEYQNALKQFDAAPLPCYVSIGNHDFHDNGLIYDDFLNRVGPMNHSFEIAGTRFINVDTAADFWPASSGQRGKLFNNLHQHRFSGEQVLFTHRPLKDPRPHDDHNVGGIGEIDYLVKQCNELGIENFLHGHVHHSAELDFEGIKQFSIGEGLGHEDLVLQKHVAKIMMARVEPEKKMQHRWEDLNMPWSDHQNPTHFDKLNTDRRAKQLEWYRNLLLEAGHNLKT